MTKPRVLLFTDWFWPGFRAGGPIRSCMNLMHTLRDQVDFSVVTGDRDLGDTVAYANVKLGEWTHTDSGVRILYVPQDWGFGRIRDIIRSETFDYLSLNSMYSLRFTLFPMAAAMRDSRRTYRILLSPRGMLAESALSLKPVKKQLFLRTFRLLGLHRKLIFHSTGDHESADIRRMFGPQVTIRMAPNLPDPVLHPQVLHVKKQDECVFLSVGRISPVKNTLGLIRMFYGVSSGKAVLRIAGPVEDEIYWQKCREEGASLPEHVRLEFRGEIRPEDISRELETCDFFVLATLGENFGHAIFEALSVGRPVIISDGTPWRNLRQQGAGHDIPLNDTRQWSDAIAHAIRMDDAEWQEMSRAASAMAQAFRNSDELIRKSVHLFRD